VYAFPGKQPPNNVFRGVNRKGGLCVLPPRDQRNLYLSGGFRVESPPTFKKKVKTPNS